MALIIAFAFIAGMLITLSRQVNGRLAHETSALGSAFWNHVVGFGVLIALALATEQIWPQAVATTPIFAWLSGAFGVVFVASGSWLIPRLGATLTGGLLVAGQMLTGVILDLVRNHDSRTWMQVMGVVLILIGVVISRRGAPRPAPSP